MALTEIRHPETGELLWRCGFIDPDWIEAGLIGRYLAQQAARVPLVPAPLPEPEAVKVKALTEPMGQFQPLRVVGALLGGLAAVAVLTAVALSGGWREAASR